MKSDFAQLYSLLGAQPGCGLDEFKHAYRRRIAELHPDKTGNAPNAEAAAAQLNELNSLFDAAMRFHRQHGRLPGAIAPRAAEPEVTFSQSTAAAAPVSPSPGQSSPAHAASGQAVAEATSRSRLTWPLLMALLLLLVALVWDSATREAAEPLVTNGDGASTPAMEVEGLVGTQLLLGMDKKSVRTIQGAPMSTQGDNWFYGPSWLRFEQDQLVDWYSSPLHRLKTTSATPEQGRTSP